MQVIILDIHPIHDGRIERHLRFLLESKYLVFHVHFNRSEITLPEGIFSQFGEKGYRIPLRKKEKYSKNDFFRSVFFYFSPSILISVKKAIKILDINLDTPTIIHVHDPVLLIIATILKKWYFSSARIVYDRHEVFEAKQTFHYLFQYPRFGRLCEIITKKHIDAIISVSKEHNKAIIKRFPGAIVDAVPNYPNSGEYNNDMILEKIENFKSNSIIHLVYVGSLADDADRDITLLLNLTEKLLESYSHLKFSIGGQCKNNQLLKRFGTIKSRFPDRFHYYGKISRKQTVYLTENAHIGFLLIKPDTTYWVRTSPNKTYEYLICGTIPIIRADIDHIDEFADCSLIFSRYTSNEDIIRGVLDLLKDTGKIKELMEKSLKLSKKFLFERVGYNYIAIYNAVLNTKNHYLDFNDSS